jgi:hypothetical protein
MEVDRFDLWRIIVDCRDQKHLIISATNQRSNRTEDGLWRSQLRLGLLFLATSAVGGISFALAAWIVALFAAETKQPSKRKRT